MFDAKTKTRESMALAKKIKDEITTTKQLMLGTATKDNGEITHHYSIGAPLIYGKPDIAILDYVIESYGSTPNEVVKAIYESDPTIVPDQIVSVELPNGNKTNLIFVPTTKETSRLLFPVAYDILGRKANCMLAIDPYVEKPVENDLSIEVVKRETNDKPVWLLNFSSGLKITCMANMDLDPMIPDLIKKLSEVVGEPKLPDDPVEIITANGLTLKGEWEVKNKDNPEGMYLRIYQ